MSHSWGYATDQRLREENQDNYGLFVFPDYTLAIVCDGMGGHVGGRQASTLAVRTIVETLQETEGVPIPEALETAVRKANDEIFQVARKHRRFMGMGTTVVAAAVRDDVATIAHVGDSRVYRVRDGEAKQLTVDHTMVNLFVEAELLSPEDAAAHPEAHVLSRSLGVEKNVDVDVQEGLKLERGDVLVLCSDGVHGPVDAAAIGRTPWADLQKGCNALVDLVRKANGDDNATVVALGFQVPTSAPNPPTDLPQPIDFEEPKPIPAPGPRRDPPETPVPAPTFDPTALFPSQDEAPVEEIAPEPSPYQDEQIESREMPVFLDTASDDAEGIVPIAPTISRSTIEIGIGGVTAAPVEKAEADEEEPAERRSLPGGKKLLAIAAALAGLIVLLSGVAVFTLGRKGSASSSEAVVTTTSTFGVDAATDAAEPAPPAIPRDPGSTTPATLTSMEANPAAEAIPPPVPRRWVYAPELPPLTRFPAHRPKRYTQPPPGGTLQLEAVRAARADDCPRALDAVAKAITESVDFASLYPQAWDCFRKQHYEPLSQAKVQDVAGFAPLLVHFQGQPNNDYRLASQPAWKRPATDGIEYRMEALIGSTEEDLFYEVMLDLLGAPKLGDQVMRDVFLEADAAAGLSQVIEPSEEVVSWWARRVYIATKAMSGIPGDLIRENRPDAVRPIDLLLETATWGAWTDPTLADGLPAPVKDAYLLGTGAEIEVEPPKPVAVRPAPPPVKEPEPEVPIDAKPIVIRHGP